MVFAGTEQIDDTTLKCIYYSKACHEKKIIYTNDPNLSVLHGDR